jgi:hypothetical protein
MMTGLSIVLVTSLILFIGSLAYAIIHDGISSQKTFQKIIAEHIAASNPKPVQRKFHSAARHQPRVPGSTIL